MRNLVKKIQEHMQSDRQLMDLIEMHKNTCSNYPHRSECIKGILVMHNDLENVLDNSED